jgi:hypothetical protein
VLADVTHTVLGRSLLIRILLFLLWQQNSVNTDTT